MTAFVGWGVKMAKFRARARALDMLGRQQIAGVPTAINELFKNAYDAYATKVEGHLIRPANLLVIRDNGIGMTMDDFENKWLVIGTESKYRADSKDNPMYRPPGMEKRPIAGEKGIGRLAIGILGTQTFIITRAARLKTVHNPIIAFVNWAAFGIPNIDLGDIEVPVRELQSAETLTDTLLLELVDAFRDALIVACRAKKTQGEEVQVLDDLSLAGEGIGTWLANLDSQGFAPSSPGTTFLIQPISPTVLDSVDRESGGPSESRIVKELAGFSNTMAKSSSSLIVPSFWDHRGVGDSTNLLGEAAFWTLKDFAMADHEIHGSVDVFGTFKGQIRIFRNPATDHLVPFAGIAGHKTDCGPFEVALGVVQGTQRESMLDPDQFAFMTRRLGRFAGVFVYRDGLRVLPYGRHDQDWLGMEERRTRHASYYFFSHRRMFGYVAVTREKNAGLKEKAGREGFQDNKAYRQFREILEQMLIQLAADFFRGKEEEPTPFRMGLLENERVNRARERYGKSKTKRLQEFRRSMLQIDELLNDDVLEQSIQDVLKVTESKLCSLPEILEPSDLVRRLVVIESDASRELTDLWKSVDFAKPRGVAIGKNLTRAYEVVADRRTRAESDLFAPAKQRIHQMVREVAQASGSSFNQRLRVTTLLDRERVAVLRNARAASSTARTVAQDVAMRVAVLSEDIVTDLDQRLRAIAIQSNEFPFEQSNDADVDRFLADCQHEVSLASEFLTGALESLADLFRSMEIDWNPESGILSSLDERQALDEEVESLKEQADNEMELAQLGLSVDIINHEFLGTVNAIRKGLRALDSWASINPDMVPLRNVLASNFNHLENFLNLFTPLRKRFNAERTSIRGTEIMDYLRSIFLERLRQNDIELQVSEEFRKRRVMSFASVILPAFTNLVDNALFWLKDRPQPRVISLDLDERDWLISDNGPGIPDRYRDSVFSAGFTTRPGGRGLGLYIARQVLERHGFTLTIEGTPRLGKGTTFRIGLKKEAEENG